MRHQIHCELYNFLRDHLAVRNICYLRNEHVVADEREKEAERHMHTFDTMTRNYASKKKHHSECLRAAFQIKVSFEFIFRVTRRKRKSTSSNMTQIMAKFSERSFFSFYTPRISYVSRLAQAILYKYDINLGRNWEHDEYLHWSPSRGNFSL